MDNNGLTKDLLRITNPYLIFTTYILSQNSLVFPRLPLMSFDTPYFLSVKPISKMSPVTEGFILTSTTAA